jgi:hypothetical protein
MTPSSGAEEIVTVHGKRPSTTQPTRSIPKRLGDDEAADLQDFTFHLLENIYTAPERRAERRKPPKS